MSIIPMSSLCRADLWRLGNNLRRARQRRRGLSTRRSRRRVLRAVNRSLSALGERVMELHPVGHAAAATLS